MTGRPLNVGLLGLSAMICCAGSPPGQVPSGVQPEPIAVLMLDKTPEVYNRHLTPFTEGSRTGVRFDEGQGDGLAYLPEVDFADGAIEFDVRGRNVPQRSFVGLAFHGADPETFDAVYFRPFNFNADDPARRSHSVQSISHPVFTWSKLREEHPGSYENSLPEPPAPDGWFHVRTVIESPRVSVYLGESTEPVLVVDQLSSRGRGWVGFWVGNGSNGDFANLALSPAQ